jgi:hypothetical protein
MSRDELSPDAVRAPTPRWWWRPQVAHYASLVLGLGYILAISGQQWFFGDDWAILAPHRDGSVLEPHVGHWNLVPALVFPALRDVVGLNSYLPFLALALLAHATVVHLSWRLMNRVGAQPWLSTALAAILLVLGGGAENILWAFQFGFIGAIAIGLAVVLLLDREKPLIPVIVALAIVAPMFSGTAIPLLAAAGILGWIRRGFLRTAVLLLPAAAVYLTWFFVVARMASAPSMGFAGPADFGRAILYAAAMYGGVIPALAVLVWAIVTIRRGVRGTVALPLALAAGSLVFVALTTYSRLDNGLSSAAAQRYAYLTITLLLPVIALILSWLAARSRRAFWVCLGVLAALIVCNAATLAVEARFQADREAGSKARIEESLEALLADPGNVSLLDAPADAKWAPDLLGSDLVRLHDDGQLP